MRNMGFRKVWAEGETRMTLDEYLKDRKHIFWDFTKGFACREYEEIENPVDRYFAYRASKPGAIKCFPAGADFAEVCNEKYREVKDPDGFGRLLQKIYEALWPDLAKEAFMQKDGWIQSDTMTSAQRTLNHTVASMLETAEEARYRMSFGSRTRVGDSYCIDLYARDREGVKERFAKVPGLITFLNLYHTLGNYIAVPCLFNAARSGNYASHDYWNLTLQKIYEWYLEKENGKKCRIIQELLHNKGDSGACEKWLRYFGDGMEGWMRFVKMYYLQDFVDQGGRPIPFCKGHSWDQIEISDCVEFFLNVNRMIYLRGCRMFDALAERSKGGER